MQSAGRADRWFDRAYLLVVVVKGVDGAVEFLLGLLLLTAPAAVGDLLSRAASEAAEGSELWRAQLAVHLGAAAHGLVGPPVAVVVFLLVHGLVKIATVYCLLRRLVRAYPWALGVLAVLLVVQSADVVLHPTPAGWCLVALDLLVLALVALEYRRLRRPRASPARSARPVTARS